MWCLLCICVMVVKRVPKSHVSPGLTELKEQIGPCLGQLQVEVTRWSLCCCMVDSSDLALSG